MIWTLIGCILIILSVIGMWHTVAILDEYPGRTSLQLYEQMRIVLVCLSVLGVVGLLMLRSPALMFAALGVIAIIWCSLEGRKVGVRVGTLVATCGVVLNYAWIL